MIRIFIWLAAFVTPALSLGVPLPHALYLVIPAFAAVDGLSGGGGFRVAVWLVLSLLYEMIYQMPLGIFAATVLIVAGVHVALGALFRIDTRVHAGRWRAGHLVRSLIVAFLWMAGMIVVSSFVGAAFTAAGGVSWYGLWVIWIVRGAALGALGIMTMILGALFWEKTLPFDKVFSDYAIIQTTDVSD